MGAFKQPVKTYSRLYTLMERGNPNPGSGPDGGSSITNVRKTLGALVGVVERAPGRYGNARLRRVNVGNVRAVIGGLEEIAAEGGPDRYAKAAELMKAWPIDGEGAPGADVGVA